MSIELRRLTGPLRRFFAELGPAAPDPAEHEELALLRVFVEELPPSAVSGLRFATCSALAETYGPALRLSFRLGELPLLELGGGAAPDEAAFARFQDEAGGLPALTLDLRLDKQDLLRRQLGDQALGRQAWLFLFPATLPRFLQAAGLPDLERLLGSSASDRLLLLTPDKDIWLDGPLLTIAGGVHAERWRDAGATRPLSALAANCHRVALKELRWESRWLHALTPFHLHVDSAGFEDEPETRALRAQLLNALLLYLADRTVAGPDALISTFAGSTHSTAVRHVAAIAGETLPTEQVQQLFALFEWTYAPEWADGERLSLAQIEIVRALATAKPDRRLALLLGNAGRILDELRWSWKELLEDRVTDYVSQVQQVESFVSETVSAYAEQVNGMVKSLSDTMLAAVGVALASFVGALLQTPIDERVLRIGLLAYAAYVLAFPLLYNMSNQWGRHWALERDFHFRRARYEQRLLPERVSQIIGDQITASRERFRRWFWLTIALYVLVILASVAAALAAPSALITSPAP